MVMLETERINQRLNLIEIDCVDTISPKDFKINYLKKGKPLIIKDYASNWPALKNWNIDFFRKTYGHIPAKLHGKWQNNNFSAIEIPYAKEAPFAEFLNMIKNNKSEAYKLFLFDLIQKAPELREDFNFPPLTLHYLKRHPLLFFGLAGSDVRLHFDIDISNIFLTQFLGTKRVTLFDKSQSAYLYKVPFTTHSAADLSKLDFEKFPILQYAKGYKCDLKPTETLFMPSGMWHQMEYLDSSFSLSLRALSTDLNEITKGVFNFLILRYFDRTMHRIADKHWTAYKLNQTFKNAEKQLLKYGF